MFSNSFLISVWLVLFLSSCVLIQAYILYAKSTGILDVPNARSAHHTLIPRGAGIVFVSIWLIWLFISFQYEWIESEFFWICYPATLMMMLLGFWEDKKSLSPRRRLFIQVIVALAVLFFFDFKIQGFHLFNTHHFLTLGVWIASIFTVLWLVWSTNLFNFMDGSDGLAAIEAIFVIGITGYLYFIYDATSLAYLAWSLCFSVLGFLIWNWPRAKVFMGDVGSYSLGFLIAIFALIGSIKFKIPFLLWMIIYGIFWFDASITLLRRLFLGKNIVMAHRDHAFQRLHQAGFSHQQVLCCVIALNTLLAFITIWANFYQQYMLLALGVTIGILAYCYYRIEKIFPMSTAK